MSALLFCKNHFICRCQVALAKIAYKLKSLKINAYVKNFTPNRYKTKATH